MLARVSVIALNTYREAVRARVLHGLFALAIATAGYALVVGAFALHSSLRVVSDLGAASISIYGIVVAVVLGATSLYRELELKTIFPILARPIRRPEYLVGKYLGTVLTLGVFIAANSGVLLLALGVEAGRDLPVPLGAALGITLLAGVLAWRSARWRTYLPIAWAFAILLAGVGCAGAAPDDRRVVLGSALLTFAEVGLVTAIATVFAAFSSPFLTAIFTFGVFVVGRSADTLARLPVRLFGAPLARGMNYLSRIVPNLMLYVPPRPLLTGEASGISLGSYLGMAVLHSLAWSVLLLTLASLLFRRRDFL
ncbi:MAG: ABC transporter permease subunit [Polyangiaceae bacterium]